MSSLLIFSQFFISESPFLFFWFVYFFISPDAKANDKLFFLKVV